MTQDKQTTCEICDRIAPTATHPCRFARACRCWYGEPCDGMTRSARRAAKAKGI